MSHYCIAIGIGTKNTKGEWLEVLFPNPLLHPSDDLSAQCKSVLDAEVVDLEPATLKTLADIFSKHNQTDQAALCERLGSKQACTVGVILDSDTAPSSVPVGYLKLQLISHRLVTPHQTNLDGIFGTLKNIAWTNEGAVDIAELAERQLNARCEGRVLQVDSIDKFPKMTDYVVPSGVRIADTARVRLGAYIGEGTTIMHEGFVNFNAGTLGTSMIEGRVSAGVVVGAGSDLGGGASIMGTLSGGGSMVISIGKESLVGANAGVGIPLGDRCTVESGLYVTAGTKVTVVSDGREQLVKARELAGKDDLLFIRNSVSGRVECRPNKNVVSLNEMLHAAN